MLTLSADVVVCRHPASLSSYTEAEHDDHRCTLELQGVCPCELEGGFAFSPVDAFSPSGTDCYSNRDFSSEVPVLQRFRSVPPLGIEEVG